MATPSGSVSDLRVDILPNQTSWTRTMLAEVDWRNAGRRKFILLMLIETICISVIIIGKGKGG